MIHIDTRCDSCGKEQHFDLDAMVLIGLKGDQTLFFTHDMEYSEAFKELSVKITEDKVSRTQRN